MSAKTILLIDDEEDLRYLLGDRLVANGFNVIEAKDGLEGLDMAEEHMPDFIVLDLMMPVMSGEQFWRQMQKNPKIKNIPFVVLTAKRQSNDHYWGASLSKEDFFSKPYNVEALIQRIREKLGMPV